MRTEPIPRACSFLPASTRMIYELGLEDHLLGVTFECASDKPKIVRSILEGKQLASPEIDRVVSDTAARGGTLYYLDEVLLADAAPDVIFTQHVCDVCFLLCEPHIAGTLRWRHRRRDSDTPHCRPGTPSAGTRLSRARDGQNVHRPVGRRVPSAEMYRPEPLLSHAGDSVDASDQHFGRILVELVI